MCVLVMYATYKSFELAIVVATLNSGLIDGNTSVVILAIQGPVTLLMGWVTKKYCDGRKPTQIKGSIHEEESK
jgi:hypothetical protein